MAGTQEAETTYRLAGAINTIAAASIYAIIGGTSPALSLSSLHNIGNLTKNDYSSGADLADEIGGQRIYGFAAVCSGDSAKFAVLESFVSKILEGATDIDPVISQYVEDNFWDLI